MSRTKNLSGRLVMGRNRCSTASSSVTSLLFGSSSGLSFSVAFNFLTPIPNCRYVGCALPRDPDAHVGCAQAQLRPACVPAAHPATGGGASQNRVTGGHAPTRDRRSRSQGFARPEVTPPVRPEVTHHARPEGAQHSCDRRERTTHATGGHAPRATGGSAPFA